MDQPAFLPARPAHVGKVRPAQPRQFAGSFGKLDGIKAVEQWPVKSECGSCSLEWLRSYWPLATGPWPLITGHCFSDLVVVLEQLLRRNIWRGRCPLVDL